TVPALASATSRKCPGPVTVMVAMAGDLEAAATLRPLDVPGRVGGVISEVMEITLCLFVY
ncbi:hypothetical protein, partial [Pantoea dispersa]